MRVIIQRVKSSQVSVAGQVIGKIGIGLNLLVGIAASDTEAELAWVARKCLDLRLFPDPDQPHRSFERSVQEMHGELLVVSQFTLYGDVRKGRRPAYDQAAPPNLAEPLYDRFVALLRESGLHVATGQFGAMMQVEIVNDGPVTLVVSREASDAKGAS